MGIPGISRWSSVELRAVCVRAVVACINYIRSELISIVNFGLLTLFEGSVFLINWNLEQIMQFSDSNVAKQL